MNFKEWLRPKVLISGVIGLALASLIGSLLFTANFASIPCRPISAKLPIDLPDTPQEFATPVCAGQTIYWTGHKTWTLTFDTNNQCVNASTFTLDEKNCDGPQTNPPTKCSLPTPVKQIKASGTGLCIYGTSGGTRDPRIIIIGK